MNLYLAISRQIFEGQRFFIKINYKILTQITTLYTYLTFTNKTISTFMSTKLFCRVQYEVVNTCEQSSRQMLFQDPIYKINLVSIPKMKYVKAITSLHQSVSESLKPFTRHIIRKIAPRPVRGGFKNPFLVLLNTLFI